MRNFELIKERFLEIIGQMPALLDPSSKHTKNKIVPTVTSTPTQSKRSVASSIFKFLFSGEDNSEAINVLKQNVATLMANDELHEERLKDILKSQQINVGRNQN